MNGGVCRDVDNYNYKCDCSGTHYKGLRCHIGEIYIPQVPLLRVQQTVTITAEAHPTRQLSVNLSTTSVDGISISPSVLVFNSLTEVSFTITAHTRGIHFLSFNLSGYDADLFEKPQSMIVVVQSADDESSNHTHFSYFDDTNQPLGILTQGCCKGEMSTQSHLSCLNHGTSPSLSSTCSWINGDETFGVVFANGDDHAVPISIAGGRLQEYYPFVDLPVSQYSCSSCGSTKCFYGDVTEEDIADFIKSRALARSFLTYTSDLLPNWVSFAITGVDSWYDDNYYSYDIIADVVHGKDITLISDCANLNVENDELYAVLRYNKSLLVSVNDIDYSYLPQLDSSPVCFAVSLCNRFSPIHVSIPMSQQEELRQINSIKVLLRSPL